MEGAVFANTEKESLIRMGIKRSNNATANLADRISSLRNRLSSVMCTVKPQPSTSDPKLMSGGDVELANEIHLHADALESLNAELQDILTRLDL